MSYQYDQYITDHRNYVYLAFSWFISDMDLDKLRQILPDINLPRVLININHHDESKYSEEEYDAYDSYFYGSYENGIPDYINDKFNLAWLHHIHANPHHWQHWVLIPDDEQFVALDMPDNYILEMICDWWSFSWKKNTECATEDRPNLYLDEMFSWYYDHKETFIFSDKTKEKVESILRIIKDGLRNGE